MQTPVYEVDSREGVRGMESLEDYHEVIYNQGYGGFSFSEKAMREYWRRMQIDYDQLPNGHVGRCPRRNYLRDDPVMIGVLKDFGDAANGKHANLTIERIPRKFAKHYTIGEYNGYENVTVDEDKYRLDMIRAALETADPSDLKERILAILDEPCDY